MIPSVVTCNPRVRTHVENILPQLSLQVQWQPRLSSYLLRNRGDGSSGCEWPQQSGLHVASQSYSTCSRFFYDVSQLCPLLFLSIVFAWCLRPNGSICVKGKTESLSKVKFIELLLQWCDKQLTPTGMYMHSDFCSAYAVLSTPSCFHMIPPAFSAEVVQNTVMESYFCDELGFVVHE